MDNPETLTTLGIQDR